MGADIHPYVERKCGTHWYVHASGFLGTFRNYDTFCALAGVCAEPGRPTPLDAPRGLPADASYNARSEYDYDGGHSPSWLTLAELREVHRRVVECRPGCRTGLEAVMAFMAAMEEGGATVRFVFWFDS